MTRWEGGRGGSDRRGRSRITRETKRLQTHSVVRLGGGGSLLLVDPARVLALSDGGERRRCAGWPWGRASRVSSVECQSASLPWIE